MEFYCKDLDFLNTLLSAVLEDVDTVTKDREHL